MSEFLTPLGELNDMQRHALEEAARVLDRSYTPYSNFNVAACLYNEETGEFVTGNNFENASYGLTICAERSAIVAANARGMRDFTGIAVIGRGKDFDTEDITAPCGACRQVIYELSQICGRNITVILSTTRMDKIEVKTIHDLLPSGFGPKDLGIDVSGYKTTHQHRTDTNS
jgi:cytidine deaminase